MELQELASTDNARLLDYTGSRVILSKKDNCGRLVSVRALVRDVSQHIDAQSGFSIGIRQISVLVSFTSLDDVNFEYRKNGEYSLTGDIIRFSTDSELKEYEIIESRPDMQFKNFTLICDVVGLRKNGDGKFKGGANDYCNQIRKKY